VGAASWHGTVLAQSTCTFTQVTNSSGGGGFEYAGGSYSIDAAGTRIAYVSIGGTILLFDVATGGSTPITSTAGGTSNFVSINADGTRIAFASDQDLTGGNADGNFEIFRFDTTTSAFTQITDTTGGGTGAPSINADGTRIAFRSPANLAGGNPDGNIEIFLFDDGLFRQITGTSLTNTVNGGPSSGPWINGEGARIVYRSNQPATDNSDENFEIFLWEGGTTQVTDTFLGQGNFMGLGSISSDGARLVFSSTFDLIAGGNSDRNGEIFLFDDGVLRQITNTARLQMTNTGATTARTSANPSINAAGNRIVFASAASDLLTGSNPDGNLELFTWDSAGFTQVTHTVGGSNDLPLASADGTRIVFRSNRDLTGGNPDGNFEIFVTACPAPALDTDGDGIFDEEDNCRYYATQHTTDTDGDGRGDLCECSDQNADGTIDVKDIIAINTAIFNPHLITPLCDGNDDDECTVADIIAANRTIFSPNSSTCERQPVPGD
jgi:Tol biopolymer transport system component